MIATALFVNVDCTRTHMLTFHQGRVCLCKRDVTRDRLIYGNANIKDQAQCCVWCMRAEFAVVTLYLTFTVLCCYLCMVRDVMSVCFQLF